MKVVCFFLLFCRIKTFQVYSLARDLDNAKDPVGLEWPARRAGKCSTPVIDQVEADPRLLTRGRREESGSTILKQMLHYLGHKHPLQRRLGEVY